MGERQDRLLSKDFIQPFMVAISEEIGNFSLQLVLQQAGYDGMAIDWPEQELAGMHSSEFAAVQRCLRDYYGRGARGLLQRVGRETWTAMIQNSSHGRKASFSLMKLAPRSYRIRQVLELLAEKLRGPGGEVSIHSQDLDFLLVDRSSDSTFGQKTAEPICWSTLGLIQGALFWAFGNEMDVEEISCRATGEEACKFRIKTN